MTPQQQDALEQLVGRALTAAEIDTIGALVDARNDAAVAALLSVGRTSVVTLMISERGVRAALSITGAYDLIRELRDAQAAPPPWLSPVLLAMGVPVEQHPAYADALASAYRWLTQDAGLDLGSAAVRGMLDLICAGVPSLAASCVTLKALAERPSPIRVNEVSESLRNV